MQDQQTERELEQIILFVAALVAIPLVIGALPALIGPVEDWLVGHSILVTTNVAWQLPGMNSGLDIPRIVIVIAAVAAVAAALVKMVRKRAAR